MTVLYLIVCGARPAESTIKHVTDLVALGWDTCVIATPDGARFFDLDHARSITGHPVRISYKAPDADDVLPAADVMVVAPATFNTVNKWAAGISDTLALGLLNEALGQGLPIIAAPWAKAALRKHPAYPPNLSSLRRAGVGVVEGKGEAGEEFPRIELLDELSRRASPSSQTGA
jgi:phosphopantothenoylcysteine synthetase/decarboxylase